MQNTKKRSSRTLDWHRVKPKPHIVAILPDIRSIHNVASMFRTADGAGIEKLYLVGVTPTPIDRFGNVVPQFKKVSLGAEHSVPWEKVSSAAPLLAKLKKDGYQIFAVEQNKQSVSYDAVRLKRGLKIAFMMGNEVSGISPALLRRADKVLEIPMHGKKESLNVSVAFGIIAYHLVA